MSGLASWPSENESNLSETSLATKIVVGGLLSYSQGGSQMARASGERVSLKGSICSILFRSGRPT